MKDKDYKEILEHIYTPIVVALANEEKESKEAENFTIHFMNKSFQEEFPDLLKTGYTVEQCIEKLSTDVEWLSMASDCLHSKSLQEKTFYSTKFSTWLHVTMNSSSNRFVIISVTNVSKDKEREQQLLRQNLRLANLTDELAQSRDILKSKLENINFLNEQLEFNAYHDSMTGLYGRQKFKDDFINWAKECQKNSTKFGLILLDIDNMKLINESQGHSAGDEVICHAADILKKFIKEDLRVYRWGGDEFILMVKKITSHDTVLNVGDTLLEIMNEGGIEFSAGISVFPDDADDVDNLLKYADMAMYDIKKRGKNNICFFQEVMREKFTEKMEIQTRLNKAMDENAFQLYYQPQFDLTSNRLRGFEALLRWFDEDLGWISPEQFVPIAEETRMIVPLGDWIMETALKTLKFWQDVYEFDGIMSVNVSPVQLKKPSFIYDLTELIKKYKIPTHSLEIEITEGVFIDNKTEVIEILKQIRKMGVGISLDDFGTGYSSMSYLQILPITTLKIDKSFISNITDKGGVEANITDSIISMVTKMGLDTIAEGVEKDEQLNILKSINCKNIQGFLKGKPMPKNDAEVILGRKL